MRLHTRIIPLSFAALASVSAGAQQRPAIRQLGAVTEKTSEQFTSVAGIRALPGGAVLVNDVAGRRVLMFDPKLSAFTVVADSTSATANAYGGRTGSLIAYRGDSSIFVDPASVSMLVIDPQGKIARVMAIPRGEDAAMIGNALGNTTLDPSGRLIYRAGAGLRFGGGGGGRVVLGGPGGGGGPGRGPIAPPEIPDSALIFAVNLATRQLDTLGYIRTPKVKLDMTRDDNGNVRMQSMLNPLPVVDDWAVLPDGTVAFVRGRDYHVDFRNPDGTMTSAAKIPFDWQRMTDEDKVAFIDSVKAARERLGANAPLPLGGAAPQPGGGGGGGAPQVMIFQGTGPGPQGGGGGGATRTNTANMGMQMQFVPASELPDYKPAFFAGSTRADLDGNLWIRTIPTAAVSGGPVYDVINRKGEIIDRVQVPENTSVIGFGAGGAVFLLNRSGTTSTLERATVR